MQEIMAKMADMAESRQEGDMCLIRQNFATSSIFAITCIAVRKWRYATTQRIWRIGPEHHYSSNRHLTLTKTSAQVVET